MAASSSSSKRNTFIPAAAAPCDDCFALQRDTDALPMGSIWAPLAAEAPRTEMHKERGCVRSPQRVSVSDATRDATVAFARRRTLARLEILTGRRSLSASVYSTAFSEAPWRTEQRNGNIRTGPYSRPMPKPQAAPRPTVRPPTTLSVIPPVGIEAVDRQLTDLGAVAELNTRIVDIISSELDDIHGLDYEVINSIAGTVSKVFNDFRKSVLTGVEGQYFERSVRSSHNQHSFASAPSISAISSIANTSHSLWQ